MKRWFGVIWASALGVVLMGAGVAGAQAVPGLDTIKSQEELTRAITELDRQLFDAYNTCNLEKFASLIADDVEFYHDRGGVTLGEKALTASVKENICGKVTRKLVESSLEVSPIHEYGAVELGVHRFYAVGAPDKAIGEAKFVHLWRYKDGAWKVTRVISYDHESVK